MTEHLDQLGRRTRLAVKQLGLSAGYVHDHVRKGGLYTALDLRTGF